MEFLNQLEASAFAQWLSISMAGFPTLIALHSVGMAVAVGLSLIVTLHLYDKLPGLQAELVPRLLTLGIWGFTLNFVTGLLLFITRGHDYITSLIFLTKMALVLISAIAMFWLRSRFTHLETQPKRAATGGLHRRIALFATVTWFGAVVTGRLIAYLSDIYR